MRAKTKQETFIVETDIFTHTSAALIHSQLEKEAKCKKVNTLATDSQSCWLLMSVGSAAVDDLNACGAVRNIHIYICTSTWHKSHSDAAPLQTRKK